MLKQPKTMGSKYPLKEPSHIFSTFFFSHFWRFWYYKKAHMFLTTHMVNLTAEKSCLEDINENVSGYGNIIKLAQ